jgi:hypothetical protein
MGSGTKPRKGQIDMGNYIQSAKEQEAMMWCVRNNIFIAPFAESTTKWYLDITINGKKNRSPDVHTKTTLWNQMFKYYIYYYEKYKKNE